MGESVQLALDALRQTCVVPLPLGILRRLSFIPKVYPDDEFVPKLHSSPHPNEDAPPSNTLTAEIEAAVAATPRFSWTVAETGNSGGLGENKSRIVSQLSETAANTFLASLSFLNSDSREETVIPESEETLVGSSPQTTIESDDLGKLAVFEDYALSNESRVQAAREDWRAAAHAFLAQPGPRTLRQVAASLSQTQAEDASTENGELVAAVAQAAEPYLGIADSGPESALAACETITRLQLLHTKSNVWANSVDITEASAATVRALAESGSPRISIVITLWAQLARTGRLAEHLAWSLLNAAQTAICQHHKNVAAWTEFVASAFSTLGVDQQNDLVVDLVNGILTSDIPAVSAESANLLLEVIAEAGCVNARVWDEAISTRDRKVIEEAANVAHDRALAICSDMSRRMIEAAYAAPKAASVRSHTTLLVSAVAEAIEKPGKPASELFLSCFVASLFRLSAVHRERAYPTFLLDILRTLHGALVAISSEDETESHPAPEEVLTELHHLVRQGNRRAAVYLASRQMTLPQQPFHDLHLLLSAGESAPPPRTVARAHWRAVLRQWPIATYARQIAKLQADAARRIDISDSHQADILRSLAPCILRDPTIFPEEVLDKLRRGSAGVCDAVVGLVAALLDAEGPSARNISRLTRACYRINAPGATNYKRHCFNLLTKWAPKSAEIQILAWRSLVLCAGQDVDRAVREAASQGLMQLFDVSDDALANALTDVARSRSTILNVALMPVLAKAERRRIQRLVHRLLSDCNWSGAAAILETDGMYMPAAQVSNVFSAAVDVTFDAVDHVAALRMLYAALTAVPRLVLSPRQVSAELKKLAARLRDCAEIEVEPIAKVLWALTSQGTVSDTSRRRSALLAMSDQALDMILPLRDNGLSGLEPAQLAKTGQLALMAGCARIWAPADTQLEKEATLHRVRLVAESLAQLATKAEPGPLRSALLRTTFRVCSAFPQFFPLPAVQLLFTAATATSGSKEWNAFVYLLIEFLASQTTTTPISQTSKTNGETGKYHGGLFQGPAAGDEAAAVLLHRHLSVVLERALDPNEDSSSLTATRLITRAISDCRLDIDRCLPTVISLTSARAPAIAQLARSAYVSLCEQWPSHVAQRLPEGLVLAAQRRHGEGGAIVAELWTTMSRHCRPLRPVIMRLLAVLRSGSAEFTRLLVEGLSRASLDPRDARALATGLEDLAYTVDSGSTKSEELARMALLLLFAQWLRHYYGKDTEGKVTTYIEAGEVLARFEASPDVSRVAFETLMDAPQEAWDEPDVQNLLARKKRRLEC